MAWIDLSQEMEFTDLAKQDFKTGMILRFNYENSITEMKIMRLDWPKVWVKEIKTMSLEDFEKEMDRRREEAQKLEESTTKLTKK